MAADLDLAQGSDLARSDLFLAEYETWAALATKKERNESLSALLDTWSLATREDLTQTYWATVRHRKRTKATPKEVASKATEAERLRTRLRDSEEEAKALRTFAARREDLIEAFAQEMAAQPVIQVTPPAISPEPHKPRSLILFLSDIHVGQLFEKVRGGGLGEYNLGVFEERVRRVTDKVIAIARDLRPGGPVDRLVIIFGGDHVDGRDIHPGHDHESVGIAAQLRVGPEIFAQILVARLAAIFPLVDIFGLPGNHGRMGRKGQFDRVEDSLDLVFMDILRVRCAGIAHITWHPYQTWFCHFELHGHTFLAAHGDSFQSWAGIPFYGAQRYLSRLQSMIHKPIDGLLVGHHHSAASFPQGMGNIVMNGSFVGTGAFGSWLGLGGLPIQKLILVNDDYPVATQYDLILARRDEVLTLEPVVLETAAAQTA